MSKVTGINITLAETQFNLSETNEDNDSNTTTTISNSTNSVDSNQIVNKQANKLIQDIFVTCSADRDRSYSLTINLELDNPFKVIDLRFNSQPTKQQRQINSSQQLESKTEDNNDGDGMFRIYLPESSFLVRLNQKISYDECLEVKYVQMEPNVNYQVECLNCNQHEKNLLDRVFGKKMTQFDAELDSILSEKLLLGLQILLNQQRLDLDLFVT